MKNKIPKAYIISECIKDISVEHGCSVAEADHIFNEHMDKKKRLKIIKRKRRSIANGKH
jgi:hypothetical protein